MHVLRGFRSGAVKLGVVMAMVLAMAGCSQKEVQAYNYIRITLGNQQVLGISAKDAMIRGVVVFFQDAGVDEFALTSDEAHVELTGSLVDAGFAIITVNRGSAQFGLPDMQSAYLTVGQLAASHYQVDNLYLLAEGMGAVPAISLMASGPKTSRVRGLVAINPVLDLSSLPADRKSAVALDYVDSHPTANPMLLPPESLQGQKMVFYADPNDPTVPAQANAFAFGDRFGSNASITVTDCSSSGEPSCYPGDDVVKQFAAMERR